MANKAVGATTATCRHCGRLRSSCRSQPQMIHAADRGVLRGRGGGCRSGGGAGRCRSIGRLVARATNGQIEVCGAAGVARASESGCTRPGFACARDEPGACFRTGQIDDSIRRFVESGSTPCGPCRRYRTRVTGGP
ncbi:hypothetical protein DIE14_16530 [Burkholderia sp. Bp9017]|nr:hypothetical protein DIE14_16530 [Burkholderia sp. Bp9017]RQZ33670.1 hypothetical protein DIE13_16440 [Burkholderia sp. Bp9016]